MAGLQTTTSGFYAGLTLHQIELHILWELGQVVGKDVSYDRFPPWLIRQKLNDRQNRFVFHSQCIKKFALIAGKEDYRQYKLPDNCMEGGIIAVKFYDTATSYEELDIVDQEYMDTVEEGYLVESSSQPDMCWNGDLFGNVPTMEVHPAPDTTGSIYDPSTDTGLASGSTAPSATTNIPGQATGGSSTTLVDTAVDFTTLGLVPGIYTINVTDGESYAYIQSIATNTITFAAALTGGTANTFAAGDSYNILAGEYGVATGWDSSGDKFIFGYSQGLVAKLTVPANNFRVDYVPYPLTFPDSGNNDQYPEIPKLYHMGLARGVVADLLRTFHEKSREFKRADVYEAMFQNDMGLAKTQKENRPFNKKPTTIRPGLRGYGRR